MTETHKPNPWGISKAEAKVLDAMIESGSTKGAARLLNLSASTIEIHCHSAGKKMSGAFGSRIRRYILWDRWRRGEPHTIEDSPP